MPLAVDCPNGDRLEHCTLIQKRRISVACLAFHTNENSNLCFCHIEKILRLRACESILFMIYVLDKHKNIDYIVKWFPEGMYL